MKSRSGSLGGAFIQSPGDVFYRNPNLAWIFFVIRDAHWTRHVIVETVGGIDISTDSFGNIVPPPTPPGGHDYFASITTNTGDLAFDSTLVGSVYLPAYQNFWNDSRWNPHWKIGFLVLPGMGQYQLSPPHALVANASPPVFLGWYTASQANDTLTALPADTVHDPDYHSVFNYIFPAEQGSLSDSAWQNIMDTFGDVDFYEFLGPDTGAPLIWQAGDTGNEYISQTNSTVPGIVLSGSQLVLYNLNIAFVAKAAAIEPLTATLGASLKTQKILFFDSGSDNTPSVGWELALKTLGTVGIDTSNFFKAAAYSTGGYNRPR